MPCPICFETDIELPITLTECGHEYCKPCIETWVLQIESGSSDPDPTCPECRCDLSEEIIGSILGRPLKKTPIPSNEILREDADTGYFEPDELTRVYLEDLEASGHAKRCPSCRAWVVLECGCQNVMCRCGCKFCFCCGKRGSCIGTTFFDNIRGREDSQCFRGRQGMILEEDVGFVIDPVFEGDFWFATEENADYIDPSKFEGIFWVPIDTEAEESPLAPLFDGKYWECSARIEAPGARNGLYIIRFIQMWEEIFDFEYDPWDGDAGPDCFGASLFG